MQLLGTRWIKTTTGSQKLTIQWDHHIRVVVVFIFVVGGDVGLAITPTNFGWHQTLVRSQRNDFVHYLWHRTNVRMCALCTYDWMNAFNARNTKEMRIVFISHSVSWRPQRNATTTVAKRKETRQRIIYWVAMVNGKWKSSPKVLCFGNARAHKLEVVGHNILFSICANNAIKDHSYQGSISGERGHCQWLPALVRIREWFSMFKCIWIFSGRSSDKRSNKKRPSIVFPPLTMALLPPIKIVSILCDKTLYFR